jgi:hypothetical protein
MALTCRFPSLAEERGNKPAIHSAVGAAASEGAQAPCLDQPEQSGRSDQLERSQRPDRPERTADHPGRLERPEHTPDTLCYHWQSRFGDIVIEVRAGVAYVNGQAVEPVKGG